MLPYMFLLTIAGNGINFKEYIYIPKKENDANWVIENSYDELREKSIINRVSIDKLFYNDSEPIKLFLRIDDNEITNELIEKLCPGITPYDRYSYSFRPFDILDFNIKEHYRSISYKEHKAKLETSLSCTSKIYEVFIDGNQIPSLEYVFYQHPNAEEQGLLTGININELEIGRHKLIVKIKQVDNDKLKIGETISIPFFKN